MANRRIFWAVQGVAIGMMGADDIETTGTTVNGKKIYKSTSKLNPVKGVQSIGINTNFNLEQAFELGQLALYENIEEVPDIEVTMEKVLDGAPLLYHLATSTVDGTASEKSGLSGRGNERCDVRLAIYPDTAEQAGKTGSTNNIPEAEVYMSGMYLSSVSYSFPTDGNFTESITLVGNHKEWCGVGEGGTAVFAAADDLGYGALGSPESAPSGVQRRQMLDVVNSTFPAEVRRAGSDGGLNATVTSRKVHINSISCSADLGREEIRELGRKGPYFRYITFPLEVSSEFEVTATSGDFVNAFEEGRSSDKSNLTDRTITFKLDDGTRIELGAKNKLNSVSYGGGDTGGGNSTITYSYSTFNDFKVFHGQDPAAKTS